MTANLDFSSFTRCKSFLLFSSLQKFFFTFILLTVLLNALKKGNTKFQKIAPQDSTFLLSNIYWLNQLHSKRCLGQCHIKQESWVDKRKIRWILSHFPLRPNTLSKVMHLRLCTKKETESGRKFFSNWSLLSLDRRHWTLKVMHCKKESKTESAECLKCWMLHSVGCVKCSMSLCWMSVSQYHLHF